MIVEHIAYGLIIGATIGRLLRMAVAYATDRRRAMDADRAMSRMPRAGSVFYPWNRR